MVAVVLPAATALPSAAVNDGQLTSSVPCATEPSARYTTPCTFVVCIARPDIGTSNSRPASNSIPRRHLSILCIAVTRRSLAACFLRLCHWLRTFAVCRCFSFVLPAFELLQQHLAQALPPPPLRRLCIAKLPDLQQQPRLCGAAFFCLL